MTSESSLWSRTLKHLGPYGHLVRVENPAYPGTPDVCYALRRRPHDLEAVTGWLELKQEDAWPARPTTHVKIASLTFEQVNWQRDWTAAGGRVFTLLQVGRRVHLLTPLTLRRVFRGELTQRALLDEVVIWGSVGYPTTLLIKALAGP